MFAAWALHTLDPFPSPGTHKTLTHTSRTQHPQYKHTQRRTQYSQTQTRRSKRRERPCSVRPRISRAPVMGGCVVPSNNSRKFSNANYSLPVTEYVRLLFPHQLSGVAREASCLPLSSFFSAHAQAISTVLLYGKSFKYSTPPPVEVSPLQASASCCSLLGTATVFL